MNLLDNDYNNYNGSLGVDYSKDKTKFVVWAPNANNVRLVLFTSNEKEYNDPPQEIIEMNRV